MVRKTKTKKIESDYGAKDIYVLEGLEPVRKRPGMYIGTTGPEGLHHLIWEVIDNGIDECMGGYASEISLTLLPNNRIKTEDNGRGIPVEKHPQTKKSALETVMTTLHAGAKFGGKAYQVAGGLHGVGVSVVCALSSWMRVEVCRGGIKYAQEYAKGKAKTKVKKIGACKNSGTAVIFEPDPEIFKEIKWDLKKILNHLRQQAYLTKAIKIKIIDRREKPEKSYNFYFEGGLASYVKYLTRGTTLRHPNLFYGAGEKNGIMVETALQYTEEYEYYEESFANNICTGEGGTHMTGFRTAITRTFNDYARKNGLLKENEENLNGEDVREGLTGVVSVKIRDPQFEGQTKAKLGNPEAKVAVETLVSETLTDFLERNPQDARSILEKCVLSQRARKAAKTARETVLRKGILEGLALPGKLADCVSRKPEESELYIVEGESAGGCFFEDTKVALTDGRNLTFKELSKEDKKGRKNYCYTIKEDGKIGIGLVQNPRKTRENAEVIKIILDSNEEIICTPDHLFMLRNSEYKKAEDLTLKDSLMPLYRKYSKIEDGFKIDGYEIIHDPKIHKWIYTHFLANEYSLQSGKNLTAKTSCIHHKDFDKLNNNPDNLLRMNKQKHLKLHSRMVKKAMARPEIQEKIRKFHQLKEFREKVRATMLKPEMRKMLSERAKKQWQDIELLKWRLQETRAQWIPEFRIKRKKAYNNTYRDKALELMTAIFGKYGELNKEKYNEERLKKNDKSLLRFDTICQRFFGSSKEKLKETVVNYNHKIKKIIKLKKKIDVYDLEVEGTHNFALASGVFVHNSSRQARDRHFQAILPLRGKILNVERARLDKILSSKEIKNLIIALGTAIAEDFNIDKIRYHRIIITCDADTDGNHIRTLLLTLFYRYFKPIIEKGYLYIAQPPLYKIQAGKEIKHAYTEDQKFQVLKSMKRTSGISIQRYKGLGEMNSGELWETTMNPENRVLLQVMVENAKESDRIFDILMGDEVLPRKKFIQAHAKKVKNLDI